MRPRNCGSAESLPGPICSGYEDLLRTLRQVGDLRWTFATHGPSQNPANISPAAVKESVLRSSRVAEVISKLAREDPSANEKELLARVRTVLEEMGHSYSIWYIRLLGFILIKAVRRMYEHIWVNAEALKKLEPLLSKRNVPVIFMPTHRSYADFLLVSFVAFHYGLPLPTIASGIDFLGMRGVSDILRRAGAFFIRRSFADDPLYRTVFAEYVQSILQQPQPLEFFVEGTRSRSGKSIYPKIGLLQAATEVYLRGSVSDVMIIPISITYERTLEENLYARELLGVPKPKESTSALIKAAGVLRDNYGSMWFHFGTPISIRDFMEGKVDRSMYNLIPRNHVAVKTEEAALVKTLAFSVVQEQQRNIRIHAWTILATALLHRLRKGHTKTSTEDILADCLTLEALINRTFSVDKSILLDIGMDAVRHCASVHKDVMRLNEEAACFVEIRPEALKNAKVVHMLLGHYRNQLLHRVSPQAMRVISSRVPSLSDHDPAAFLSRLFAWEFVSHDSSAAADFDLSSGDDDSSTDRSLLIELIEPFLVGYAIVIRLLVRDRFATSASLKTARVLAKDLQRTIGVVLEAGAYSAFEILSLDLISNCILALKSMGALQTESDQSLLLRRDVLADVGAQLDAFLQPALLVAISGAIDCL
ncbi:Dihydroxyacetone phosphate acyltransferase [Hypsibius exemplaris]|uniref:Dihydroxyacetone phosphate acyltransferase n=1 Tax=Hypsibius exemplaris TaxID=2072580 RepID=A0A1W0X9J8_HYPEX|nr:Dihydroxyacetone phosphate acyltransferase [Hypsibius exemplaris]